MKSKVIGINKRQICAGIRYIMDSVQINLISLSEEFYKYLKSIESYDYSYGEYLIDQPTFVNTNMTIGYGFFGSYSVQSRILRFD
ncbi:MAG: DUF4249 family protein [Bacteroidales bacterium]|nr:DUF4249 family protein [Bacteroidales bacterium]